MKNFLYLIPLTFIVSCGPSESELAAIEEVKQAELQAVEQARQIEIAKCVRFNSNLVYEEAYTRNKQVYGDMDEALEGAYRAMGSYKTSNMIKDAQPNAAKKRNKYIPYLTEMCEETLLFIYNNEQEIPSRFGLNDDKKVETKID
jgi:hypothetical protein